MRASEVHRQYNDTTRRLSAEAEEKRQDLLALSGEPASAKAVETANNAFIEAEAALKAHRAAVPNLVRNYRVMSLDGEDVLHRFTDEHGMANIRAHKEVAVAMQIPKYSLEEQLPNGSWVAYHKSREEREDIPGTSAPA